MMRRPWTLLALLAIAYLSAPTSLTAERALAVDVEVVTVADSTAVIDWTTAARAANGVLAPLPVITTLEYRPASKDDWRRLQDSLVSAYHRAELTDLDPDRAYVYRILASGISLPDSLLAEGRFETLPRPPGDYLFSFATVADLQIALPGDPYYAVISEVRRGDGASEMLIGKDRVGQLFRTSADISRRLMLDINRHAEVAFTVVKGDLTQGSLEAEFREARRILDLLRAPFYAVPGNHDALLLPSTNGRSIWKNYFRNSRRQSFVHKGFRFLLLDSTYERVDGGTSHEGFLDADQIHWLQREISSSREPVFILMHHPPHRITLSGGQPAEPALDAIFAEGPVIGVFAAHGHRNALLSDPGEITATGSPPVVEGGPAVMYPGGFHIYRVFTGGYIQSFYQHSNLAALAESRSIQRNGPFAKQLSGLGEMAARNFTYLLEEHKLIPARAD